MPLVVAAAVFVPQNGFDAANIRFFPIDQHFAAFFFYIIGVSVSYSTVKAVSTVSMLLVLAGTM